MMMTFIHDDLLLEILVRLADAGTAIRCAAVCKRWQSLVLNPEFVGMFTKHHSSVNANKKLETFFYYSYFSGRRSFYQLSLPNQSESESEYEQAHEWDLSFLPRSPPELLKERRKNNMRKWLPADCDIVIRATCDDLVLLSRSSRHYIVCNWLTKEWVPLPEVIDEFAFDLLHHRSQGFALLRGGGDSYKVVLVYFSFEGQFAVQTTTFDTHTFQWTTFGVRQPREHPLLLLPFEVAATATAGGTIHWLEGGYRLVTLDLSSRETRLIPLPEEISRQGYRDRVRVGVVRGRVWLSEMTLKADSRLFGLRVWKLLDGGSWRLVHDVELGGRCLFLVAFDPCDDGAIFLVRDTGIFRYDFHTEMHRRVCEFLCPSESIDDIKRQVAEDLKVLTVAHPAWPTSISPFETPNG